MDDFLDWLIPVIFIGVVIALSIIIWCCISWCESEDSGELENFQTRNINIKGQRNTTKTWNTDFIIVCQNLIDLDLYSGILI